MLCIPIIASCLWSVKRIAKVTEKSLIFIRLLVKTCKLRALYMNITKWHENKNQAALELCGCHRAGPASAAGCVYKQPYFRRWLAGGAGAITDNSAPVCHGNMGKAKHKENHGLRTACVLVHANMQEQSLPHGGDSEHETHRAFLFYAPPTVMQTQTRQNRRDFAGFVA